MTMFSFLGEQKQASKQKDIFASATFLSSTFCCSPFFPFVAGPWCLRRFFFKVVRGPNLGLKADSFIGNTCALCSWNSSVKKITQLPSAHKGLSQFIFFAWKLKLGKSWCLEPDIRLEDETFHDLMFDLTYYFAFLLKKVSCVHLTFLDKELIYFFCLSWKSQSQWKGEENGKCYTCIILGSGKTFGRKEILM